LLLPLASLAGGRSKGWSSIFACDLDRLRSALQPAQLNETQLRTIAQIEQFLLGSAPIEFSATGDDVGRYEHISGVLKSIDYPRCSKRERGTLRRYLQRTIGQTLRRARGSNSLVTALPTPTFRF